MKSNNSRVSEEKIKKATEFLQKLWWFCFYLIIAPLATAFTGFWIFSLFPGGIYLALPLAVLTFMFALLFFYKAFDKYRNRPFFLNKENNLVARIHILYLISIVSFIVTPIFVIISPEDYSFAILPLISFIVLYNIVYFYYYFQPIGFYDINQEKFRHTINLKLMIKQPYNFMIVINYVVHIVFLAVTFSTELSWLFSLITNLIFYYITYFNTKIQRSKIKEKIKEKESFLQDLTIFKQRFAVSVLNLIFVLLIQMPFVVVFTSVLSGSQYSVLELINSSFLTLIFIIAYFKSRFYLLFHYSRILSIYHHSERSYNINNDVENNKYQKYNAALSVVLILFIILFCFLISNPILILLILPFLYIPFYYEQKAKFSPKKYNKYVFLLNSIGILISISFGILPLISTVFFINIQFIVFLISLYLILQIFVKYDYFHKEDIIIFQNIIAVITFSLITYSFFPIIIINYIRFTSDPVIIIFSNFLLHSTFILIILLVSFYILYSRIFYAKRTKLFRICIFTNIFLIELLIFILINLRAYLILEIFPFFQVVMVSSILFPIIFILFIFMNFLIGLFSYNDFLNYSYYSLWILIFDIFLAILINSLDSFIVLTLDLLLLSIFSYLNLKYAFKIEKIKESTFKKFVEFNSYLMTIELATLIFFFFYSIVLVNLTIYQNIVFSIYFSLIIMTIFVNLFSRNEFFFSKSVSIKTNLITLGFSAGLTFYYSYILTLNTFYVLLIPFMCFFFVLFFPIYYLLKMKIYENLSRKFLLMDCILIAGSITLIPPIISLDHYFRLGLPSNPISVVNYSLYIVFGILIFTYYLIRHYHMKDIYTSRILKTQAIIEVILAGTTVFYYIFLLLYGTLYGLFLSLIAASIFFYLPSVYSYKKRLFNENVLKKIIVGNSLILSGLITSIPTFVGLEMERLGLSIHIIHITTITLFLFFGTLKFLSFLSHKFSLKEKSISFLKLVQIFTWLTISIFLAIELPIIFSFQYFSLFIISNSCLIFFIVNIYTVILLFNYSKELKIHRYLRDILLYGITFSLSFVFVFLIHDSTILNLFPSILRQYNLVWYLGLFFLLVLILLKIFTNFIEVGFKKLKDGLEFISWLFTKVIVCLFLIFIFSYTIFTQIMLYILTFTFLTPITLAYLKKLDLFSEGNQLIIKKLTVILFSISLLSFYIEIFYISSNSILFFNQNPGFQISIIVANVILFLSYLWIEVNEIIENISDYKIFGFYLLSILLFISLLYFNSMLSIFLFILSYTLILSKRSLFPLFRFLSYLILSFITLIKIIALLDYYEIKFEFNLIFIGLSFNIYLLTFISVLLTSVLLNYKKNNLLEKFSLYTSFSILAFVYLITYTHILILYDLTISAFIFLLVVGIHYYREKDEIYKWFIKPCILLFLFDFISFISYSLLFNHPPYLDFYPILTFTLTMSVTGFGFVLLYNKSSERFRKISFIINLLSVILSFPIFIYFLISSSLSIPFGDPIPIIIAINLSVLLFYISIGIYQWKISWMIWKSGWYAWIIIPLANFYIIYRGLTGIDVATNSLELFGIYDFSGSLIISIIICSLMFLPVLYTKIKKYFFHIIFIIWAESLFLLYWISQNLFVADILLRNIFFILFSVVLLFPAFAIFKYWKIASIIWLLSLLVNAFFWQFYLMSLNISLEIASSINILIIGLCLIVYSFFPNIRSIGLILIISYFTVLIGIFLTVYFILYSVILNPIFSVNISLIVVGLSLFSNKYLKLRNRPIDLFLSWILILNFAWLTFNTFSLLPIPGFLLFSFFIALTVFGTSFFVFNHFKMNIPINTVIPYLVVTIGASSSISLLFLIFFNISIGIFITIFSIIFIIFIYFLITEYRYILWFLFPIPITLPILEMILVFEVVRPFWYLTWALLYLVSFQILTNLFKNLVKEEKAEIKNSILKLYEDKTQVKWLNFTCYILNSLLISLLIGIILPLTLRQLLFTQILIIYQILDFLIIWSILFLLCLRYVIKSEIEFKVQDTLLYINHISLILYLIIPAGLSLNFFIYSIFISLNPIVSIYLCILILSGGVLFETFIIDRHSFYYLFNSTRNKFILLSWFIFCNTLSIFLFHFHLNLLLLMLTISVLNLISIYFLSYLDISRHKISIYRVILYYNTFIWGSFYLASLLSDGLLLIFHELEELVYYSLFVQNASFLLFLLSNIFIKVEERVKKRVELSLILSFQIFLAINWIILLITYNILTFFLIFLLVLIETCISFVSVYYFDFIFTKEKFPEFKTKFYSFLVLILYIEISLMTFGLLFERLGIFESIIISQLILFILTLLDIYFLKKINKSYGNFIHTICYFIISLFTLLSINQFIRQYPILLSLEFMIFIIMQVYTNYSLFTALNHLYPDKKESLIKHRAYITHVLGVCFYFILFFLLLQGLLLLEVNPQLVFLSLSLMVHILMILDLYIIRLLGKIANYFRLISWIFIMIFTTSYLIWLYVDYFIQLLATSIPLIILILIIETAYLFYLLSFSKYIVSNKKKIRFLLILVLYLDVVIWPLFYLTFNLLHVLNLIVISSIILFVLTYIDKYVGVFEDKSLSNLRKSVFLIIRVLFSVDVYILLGFVPNTNFFLNISVALLILVFFLGIVVKPFKEHSFKAFAFWFVFSLLLSSILLQVSLNYALSGAILFITMLIYPFVFLLEELRELFSKFLDALVIFLRKIKQAIVNILNKISKFLKTYYKLIWILFSLFISPYCGLLLSPLFLNYLSWYHSILVTIAMFGLLYLVIPSKKSKDPDIIFKRRMIRFTVGWGSAITVIFMFITPIYYILTVFIAIAVIGTFVLVYMGRKEEREKLSVKWRFYTLITLFIAFIFFGIMLVLQLIFGF
ncbi:MAG: hypothetical protein ACFFB0_03070 [Promethearchaeota archaeon]